MVRSLRPQPRTPLFLAATPSRRLLRIAEALSANPGNTRTLVEWAPPLATTPRTLARRFREEASISFSAYRQQVRPHAALQRLAQSETVANIAHAVGVKLQHEASESLEIL